MLYISDLDGTLLNSNAELSNYTRDKLLGLIENGVNFTIASARSIVSIQKVLSGLHLSLPVIELGGAFISDFNSGKHLIVNDIPSKTASGIYSYLSERGIFPYITIYNGSEDCLCYENIVNGGQEWYHNNRATQRDKRLRRISDLSVSLKDQVVCFTVIDKRDILDKLYAQINKSYGSQVHMYLSKNIYSPIWHWLTIYSAKATKSEAISAFRNEFGFLDEKLTVFGDDLSDISMFRCADTAVTVSNALDKIKKQADIIIGSNDDDSVAKYIYCDFYRSA